jgi:hypothetical protein
MMQSRSMCCSKCGSRSEIHWPRLARPGGRGLRAEHFRHALDEGELLALEEFLRAVLAVELGELGLVVEELELAR